MDINKILKSDYLDILFEGRNKTYGGYELRKTYPQRMRNAGIFLLAFGLLAFAYNVFAHRAKTVKAPPPMPKEVVLAPPPPIDETKPPPPPPPSAPPPPVKPTVQFTPPVVKEDQEVQEDEKPAEKEELKEAAAGAQTAEGDPNGIDPGIIDKPGTGTGAVEAGPPPPQIFTYVEQQPAFPGDVSAYLSEHISYPEAARNAGKEGRVVVKFVVNEDGSISDVQVLRGFGFGSEEEAKRVVAGMPKWKPGKQNGRPVKVYFSLPITFQLE